MTLENCKGSSSCIFTLWIIMKNTKTQGISLLQWLTFQGMATTQATAPPALVRSPVLASLDHRHICAAVGKGVGYFCRSRTRSRWEFLKDRRSFSHPHSFQFVPADFSLPFSHPHSAFLSFLISGLHDSTAISGSTLPTEAVGCPHCPISSCTSTRTSPYDKPLILASCSDSTSQGEF